MAAFTLTITDGDDSLVDVHMRWDPPIDQDRMVTAAQRAGVLVVKDLRNRLSGKTVDEQEEDSLEDTP